MKRLFAFSFALVVLLALGCNRAARVKILSPETKVDVSVEGRLSFEFGVDYLVDDPGDGRIVEVVLIGRKRGAVSGVETG